MPTSLLEQWPRILWLCGEAREPGVVLDVGPGHGKAAVLLREYVAGVEGVYALEAHEPYVDEYQLRRLYDRVTIGRFEDMPERWLQGADTVLLVDVIEHMAIEPAVAAIDRCRGQVIICTPCAFEEAWEPGMPDTEHHVSLWGPAEFAMTKHPVECIEEQYGGWLVRLAPKG